MQNTARQSESKLRLPDWAFYPLLAIIIALLTGVWSLGDWLVLSPDSFRYLRGARSLAEHGTFGFGRLLLPPGFSCLLYFMMTPDGLPLFEARLLLIVGWLATAILTHVYYRELRHVRWISVFVALSPSLLIQSEYLLSELAFMPFALAALLQFEAWRAGRLSWWRILLGVFCCAAAILIRTMGVVLIPLGLIALARRKQRSDSDGPQVNANDDALGKQGIAQQKGIARVIAGTLLVIATIYPQLQWSARERSYPDEYGYSRILFNSRAGENVDDSFVTLQLKRFVEFAPLRLASIKEAVVPTRLGWRLFQPPLATISTWLIGGGIFILLCWRAWRYRMLIDYFALLTLALLSIWPWDEGVRFVLPLLPVLWAVVVGGVDMLASLLGAPSSKRRRIAVAAMLVFPLLAMSYENTIIINSSPERAEKAAGRLADMQSVAKQAAPFLDGSVRIGCVLENESLDKTTVIGAMYLERRYLWPVIDVKARQKVDWQRLNGAVVFVGADILETDPPGTYDLLTSLTDKRLQVIALPKYAND